MHTSSGVACGLSLGLRLRDNLLGREEGAPVCAWPSPSALDGVCANRARCADKVLAAVLPGAAVSIPLTLESGVSALEGAVAAIEGVAPLPAAVAGVAREERVAVLVSGAAVMARARDFGGGEGRGCGIEV